MTQNGSSARAAAGPGKVWAHVGQPFSAAAFDVVVLGAGRMGALATYYLRQVAPHLSLLLVEEGGLPNEEGATILAPGVWRTLDLPPAQQDRARWSREQLRHAFGEVQFRERPWIRLLSPEAASAGSVPSRTVPSRDVLPPELLSLIDPERLPLAQVDREAATYRPASVALNAAQAAIRAGANLLLNTRAFPQPGGGLRLERLTVTNTHQIVTHEVIRIRAGTVVIAAGAAGPRLVEQHLGFHTRHGSSYQQSPRLERPSTDQTPVLQVGGLTLLPQHGGFGLVVQPHARDPHGYQPTGGTLTGVPTGLRREVLEDLVEQMPDLPALAEEGLQVGRSISDIAGAWVALPQGKPDGFPQWERVGGAEGSAEHPVTEHPVYLLLGGPHADTLGPSTAFDLAGQVAGEARRIAE